MDKPHHWSRFIGKGFILCVAVWIISSLAAPEARALPVLLSNTGVTETEISAFFDVNNPVDVLDSTFDFSPPTPGGDGVVHSVVLPGKAPSTGGLYLYGYQIEVSLTSSDAVSGISLPFQDIVPGVDINDDSSADSSIYCTSGVDCSGSVAPFASKWDDLGDIDPSNDVLSFSFLFDVLNPGETSYYFGAISSRAPAIATANLSDSGGEASPDVLAPVPEPSSIMLLGMGMIMIIGVSRVLRRRKI